MSDNGEKDESKSIPAEKRWVKFDENTSDSHANGPAAAVIDTETVEIDMEKVKQTFTSPESTPQKMSQNIAIPSSTDMRNINLNDENSHSTMVETAIIPRGFANGDIIVTVLPVNTKWPWITPAEFRPELVPEELMAEGLTLTVEDYVQIMEILVNDVRFTAYNLCYKRLLMAWLMASFIVLLGLLFSGAKGITLFGCGVIWLIINAGAIFLCMWMKNKMNHGLERAVSKANQSLIRHRIVLGVDDRGKLSCHKTNLCFIYFDTTDCVKKLQAVIETEENANRTQTDSTVNAEEQRRQRDLRLRMDIDDSDIVVTGSNPTRISRKQESAERLLLRYLQRWSKEFLRHRLDWSVDDSYNTYNSANPSFGPAPSANYPRPRHLSPALCPCQFIEDYLRNKPRKDPRSCCCSCAPFN